MNTDTLIDLRNVCEPTLSMRLKKSLKDAEFNTCLHFLTNDPFAFRQVKILCKKQGHHWRVLESSKKTNYFQIRIGKPTLAQQTIKQKYLHAALTL